MDDYGVSTIVSIRVSQDDFILLLFSMLSCLFPSATIIPIRKYTCNFIYILSWVDFLFHVCTTATYSHIERHVSMSTMVCLSADGRFLSLSRRSRTLNLWPTNGNSIYGAGACVLLGTGHRPKRFPSYPYTLHGKQPFNFCCYSTTLSLACEYSQTIMVATTNRGTAEHYDSTSSEADSSAHLSKVERKAAKKALRANETKEERQARRAAKKAAKLLKVKTPVEQSKKRKLDSEITLDSVPSATDNEHGQTKRAKVEAAAAFEQSLLQSATGNAMVSPDEFRKANHMNISGFDELGQNAYSVPDPVMTFSDAPFSEVLLKLFAAAKYEKPSPIQSQAWPICMQGRDIISVARTGSGKTLGFLLPVFAQIKRIEKLPYLPTEAEKIYGRPTNGPTEPYAIVLAPTRELAMQIDEEAQKFGKAQGIRSVCIYGGQSKWFQISQMTRSKPRIIIATPGRLNDMCNMGKISLKKVAVLVLDEADRMLDMGFEPQLDEIRRHMPSQVTGSERPLPSSGKCDHCSRQTLLFTATWPKSVERIARNLLVNPIQLNVGQTGVLVANEDVKQEIIVLEEDQKKDRLTEILKSLPENSKTIVFTMMKSTCQRTANNLWDAGYNCDALHGDKEQRDRTRIMAAFKSGEVPLLLATDVAARGLDVKDITHVINYDFPRTKGKAGIEDFVHRIGRTGRAGAKGTAITFFTRENKNNAGELVKLLKRAKQDVSPTLEALVVQNSRRGCSGNGNGRRFGGRGRGRGRGGGGGRGGWGGSR